MKSFLAIFSVISLMATAALADDVTEVIEEALEAYADGDIKGAKSDLEFVIQLLIQMESAGLEDFLPAALDGWEMELDSESSAAVAQLSGGIFAKAIYTNPDGAEFDIQIMAGGQMVMAMGALFKSAGALASGGKLIRIQREKFTISDDEIMGMVGDNVLVQATGYDADQADMLAHLEAMDMKALADY